MTAGEPTTSFRPRSAYLGHLVVGSGDGAVLVEPSVAGELRMAAAMAGVRPTAGLLYGHRYHDQIGGYTLVDGFVPAESPELVPTEADPAVIRNRLRAEAARSYPGASEVGWWRTSARPGEERRPDGDVWPDPGMWPLSERPEGIGLVVFADGTPPATAAPAQHTVVQGTVLEDRLTPAPARQEPAPARQEPAPAPATSLQPAPYPAASNGRPARGRIGKPVQSPLLVHQDELRSRRPPEHERRGLFDLEPQQWVLLAIVLLVLVVVITISVMVSRVVH